ncbi:MAG: glycosyltransferase family 4 protein [Oscillospiraceae bacterium]|nr:glycosyltransferase family 4 protein [Oscillospiraceae bacterium]
MIRVMNIISDTNIGGAGRVLLNYLKYCDRTRFRVSVALPEGSALLDPLRALDAPLYEIGGMADRSADAAAIRLLQDVIRREGADIVHTHGSLSGRIAGRRCGCAVVYTRHSAFPVKSCIRRPPGRWLNKAFNEHYADRIIAVSPAAAQNLYDGGISPKLVVTMMNGVEPVPRLPDAAVRAFRAAHGIGDGDFVAGILARIEDYKGHMDILEAVHLARERGYPQLRLLVAGTGGYEAEVRARCHALGLDDAVRFLGFVEDVAPVLSALDVQLNASWGTETSSLSILEGFSMGLPAVVSDYGGNPCLIEQGVNGFLFPARDAHVLADALCALMDAPEQRSALGMGARRIYQERFTGARFARDVEEIYTELYEEKQHGKRK